MSSYKLCLPHRICCCCDLSTGGMLLGWLGGITYFSNMVMGITTFTQSTLIELPPDTTVTNQEFVELVARAILALDILISLVNFIGCICLTIGTMKRTASFLKPWLYGQLFVIITWVVVDLVMINIILRKYSIVYLAALIVLTSGILIILYLWFCMYAFYKKLRNDEQLLLRNMELPRESFKRNPSL